jgi:integrase
MVSAEAAQRGVLQAILNLHAAGKFKSVLTDLGGSVRPKSVRPKYDALNCPSRASRSLASSPKLKPHWILHSGSWTWCKELEILRHFFRFCPDNEWILRNWSEKVQMPKNLKPALREPYQLSEVARIIAACVTIGRGAYERSRARAMVLLLRYTALRIGDVAMLERNQVKDREIFVPTTKNGKAVRLPIHRDLQAALDVLPVPRVRSRLPIFLLEW